MTALRRWLTETALPLWHEAGFATAPGRFHERLDGGARPLAVPLRATVQARQIFVFAHAACLGWFPGGERVPVARARISGCGSKRCMRAPTAMAWPGR